MSRLGIESPFAGMRGLISTFFEKAAALVGVSAEACLRGPSTLSVAEREFIATYVSARNECTYCATVHGAVAKRLGYDPVAVDYALDGGVAGAAPVSKKMRILLYIADKVREHPRATSNGDLLMAQEVATAEEIHDVVLVAS